MGPISWPETITRRSIFLDDFNSKFPLIISHVSREGRESMSEDRAGIMPTSVSFFGRSSVVDVLWNARRIYDVTTNAGYGCVEMEVHTQSTSSRAVQSLRHKRWWGNTRRRYVAIITGHPVKRVVIRSSRLAKWSTLLTGIWLGTLDSTDSEQLWMTHHDNPLQTLTAEWRYGELQFSCHPVCQRIIGIESSLEWDVWKYKTISSCYRQNQSLF